MRKDDRIGYVDHKSQFVCFRCITDESQYDNEENTVVLASDAWKSEVGPCRCGAFPGEL